MSKVRIIFVLGIALLLVAAAVQLPHSGAYFSDVQTATVTIRTGVCRRRRIAWWWTKIRPSWLGRFMVLVPDFMA